MNAKKVACSDCGGSPKICGCDYLNDHGPWSVQCTICGKETAVWAYQREAWKQWKTDNHKIKPEEAL